MGNILLGGIELIGIGLGVVGVLQIIAVLYYRRQPDELPEEID